MFLFFACLLFFPTKTDVYCSYFCCSNVRSSHFLRKSLTGTKEHEIKESRISSFKARRFEYRPTANVDLVLWLRNGLNGALVMSCVGLVVVEWSKYD